ncbi:hypothetical protein [Nocardiopsis valliformis]|uniref:hypothetical protein n=1 Tax=Nocardiopsis valliformis TaxID=239974 RepID=UPI00034B5537|nr:hypothetical protein [Nocardiopsis valliformis]
MTNPPEHPGAHPVAPAKAPGKRGYWWSGGLTLTGVLLFTAVYLFSLSPSFPEPDIVERMDSGDRITFEVGEDEDGEWAVYHSAGGSYVPLPCFLHPPNGERTPPDDEGWHHSQSFGGWGAVGPLETPEPGTYTLICSSNTAEEFALGDTGPLHLRSAVLVGSEITALGITPLLLLAAIVVGVVTALRRRSARKLTPAPHAAPPQQYPSPQSPPQQHPHQH